MWLCAEPQRSGREAGIASIPVNRRTRAYGTIDQNQIYVTSMGHCFHFSRFCRGYGAVNPDW